MTQLLVLGLGAEQILINAEPTQSQIVGGAVNRPTVGVTSLTNTVSGLDLRIAVVDIVNPLPPELANFAIRSISINGRRNTTTQAWTLLWQQIWATKFPSQALAVSRQGDAQLSRHQVTLKEIIVPGTNQTLEQALGSAPRADVIAITTPPEVAVQPLLDVEAGQELDLAVIDVTITPGGQLSTVYADSSQNLQSFPVPPLATAAITAGSAGTALTADFSTTSARATKAINLEGGNSTTGLGSIPYQSAVDTTQLLAPNTTSQRRFLMQQGSGTIGAVPQWTAITSADLGAFVGDVKGSVVADDSTLMVDGVSGRIVGPIQSASATVGTLAVTTTATGITASMVGLGNVTNESKATMFTSPTFTGLVTTPTAIYTHYYRLAANVTGISTASDFYGATDAAVLDADSFYEIYYYLEFSKQTTNNALVFTTVNTTAPQLLTAVVDAFYIGGGNVTLAAAAQGLNRSTATTNTVATTGVMSFSPEQNGQIRLRVFLRTNASNGGNIRVQVSTATGTCTALAGSYYTVIKHPTANSGSFVA